MSFFIIKQTPLPSRHQTKGLDEFIRFRVLELTYTAWDLEAFSKDCGYDGPPFVWDEARRFQIRCELDAAFFHLYGLTRGDRTPETDDVAYVMDTFPIVRRKDQERHGGRYVTKETILDLYDAMATAAADGRAFVSPLMPPPGPFADAAGAFLPLPAWPVGGDQPGDWPVHVHPELWNDARHVRLAWFLLRLLGLGKRVKDNALRYGIALAFSDEQRRARREGGEPAAEERPELLGYLRVRDRLRACGIIDMAGEGVDALVTLGGRPLALAERPEDEARVQEAWALLPGIIERIQARLPMMGGDVPNEASDEPRSPEPDARTTTPV